MIRNKYQDALDSLMNGDDLCGTAWDVLQELADKMNKYQEALDWLMDENEPRGNEWDVLQELVDKEVESVLQK